ncbi:hypothetical protein NPIL_46211 [Nephila pilipes]|uniref:Uncharacterized protein n=1 Tax=Nephila pilipes TaxID=299642 RepID=A0A8X6UN83_NEPPI|nr:hypothetical protein NPIL_46211 [Nephila pilipes]
MGLRYLVKDLNRVSRRNRNQTPNRTVFSTKTSWLGMLPDVSLGHNVRLTGGSPFPMIFGDAWGSSMVDNQAIANKRCGT